MTEPAQPTWIKERDGIKVIKEGSAEIVYNDQVFYNPIQEFNRDMSVAAIKVWNEMTIAGKKDIEPIELQIIDIPDKLSKQEKKKFKQLRELQELFQKSDLKVVDLESPQCNASDFTILEALSASGLRSIRYAKEIKHLKKIVANDLSKEAAEAITKNAEFNGVENLVHANQGDACQVLYQAVGSRKLYDVIDLDPYGTAAPFLDGAVQAVKDGGLLCVTCTDLAVLAGSQPEACWAKYGGINIPNAPFTHEMALRILLHSIQSTANKYKRAIEPLMSCSIDYYVRVFVRVHSNATLVKQASSKTSLVYYCQNCKSFETQPFGKFIQTEKGSKFGPSLVNVDPVCKVGGPFYSASIHNQEFVKRMIGHVAHNHELYGTWERMAGMSVMISEELDIPFYYVMPKMCGILHCSTPPLNVIVSGLLSTGYKVSQSHAMQQAMKTNAPPNVVWDVMRRWYLKTETKTLGSTTPGAKILDTAPTTEVSFDVLPEATPFSATFKLVRFQENPTANWGPQAKPGREPKDKRKSQSPKSKSQKKPKID